MMPNLKEVKQPKTLMELFRMDHNPQYLIKDDRGQWRVGKIKMDFLNEKFGIKFNDGYGIQALTRESDIEKYLKEIYEIDELFDMIKDGK